MLVSCLCCYMMQNAGPHLCKHEKKMNTFHHRCIRIILGITNRQQWTERITMKELRRRWGDEELAAEKITKRRLEWLGHML